MKKFLFGLLLFLSSFTASVLAAPGDPCINISLEGRDGPITPQSNWAEHMVVRGEDGYLWKRAIITSQAHGLEVEERGEVKVHGLAEKYQEVQVFVYAAVDNDPNDDREGIIPPGSGDGICWQAGEAGPFGKFVFSINGQWLWPNIGEKMVIDAFYRTNMLWETYQLHQADSNAQVFVGSHVNPRIVSIVGPNPEAVCDEICDTGVVKSLVLTGDDFQPDLLGTNFDDPALAGRVTIGRMGAHTFFTATGDGGANGEVAYRWVTHKAIAMEILKRALLGNKNAGGVAPGLDAITVADFEDAFMSRGDASKETREIVLNLRAALITPPAITPENANMIPMSLSSEGEEKETLVQAAHKFLFQVQSLVQHVTALSPAQQKNHQEISTNALAPPIRNFPETPVLFDTLADVNPPLHPDVPPPPPTPISREDAIEYLTDLMYPAPDVVDAKITNPNLIAELFPPFDVNVRDPKLWAEHITRLIQFWTGQANPNLCLLVDDQTKEDNFEYKQAGETLVQCGYPYSSGMTPTLLVRTKGALKLIPDFVDVALTTSDRLFTDGQSWDFTEGDTKTIRYKYKSYAPFENSFVGESCIQKKDISDYARFLGDVLVLDPQEESIIEYELEAALKESSSFVRILLANPSDIAQRIRWNNGDERLDIFQLFFAVEDGSCGGTDFGSVELVAPEERGGFEAGLLP